MRSRSDRYIGSPYQKSWWSTLYWMKIKFKQQNKNKITTTGQQIKFLTRMKKCLQCLNLLWNVLWCFFIKSTPATGWPKKPFISRIMAPFKWRARSSHNSFWSSENDTLFIFRPSDVLPSISNRALEMASSVIFVLTYVIRFGVDPI